MAGDLLPGKDPAERDRLTVATGFLAIGPSAVNVKPEQFRMDQIDDQIDVTSRAFLGMTVACARCHDHKFDPIPTSDYYALAGIFHSTKTFSGVANGRKTAVDEDLLSLASKDKRATVSAGRGPSRAQAVAGNRHDRRPDRRAPPPRPSALKCQGGATQRRQKIAPRERRSWRIRSPAHRRPPPSRRVARDRRDEIKELQDKRDELASIPIKTVQLAMGARDEVDADQLQRARARAK